MRLKTDERLASFKIAKVDPMQQEPPLGMLGLSPTLITDIAFDN